MQKVLNLVNSVFILGIFLIPIFVNAVGAPDYLPNGPHPRTAITSNVITKLQAINTSASNVWWNRMKSEADNDIVNAGNWSASEKIPHTYALLWLVTGDTKYRDAGIIALEAHLNHYDDLSVGNTSGYRASVSDSYRWNSQNLFSAYDWLYNDLSSIQRQNFANMLCNFATYQKNNGYKSTDPGNNYFGAQFRGAILAGIVTYGETVSNPPGDINGTTDQPLTLLNWGRTTKFDYVKAAMNTGEGPLHGRYAKGVYPEGPEYAPQTLLYIYYALDALKISTEQNLFVDIDDWLIKNIYLQLHQSAPDNGRSFPRNDYANNSIAVDPVKPNRQKCIMMEIAIKEKQGSIEAGYAQHWLKNTELEWSVNNWWAPSKEDSWHFIFYDETHTDTSYSDVIGTTFYSENNLGHILSRHAWTNDSIWWGYTMGWRGTDHMHSESGHFAIKRKGEWVIGHEVGWAGQWLYTDVHNCMMLENKPPINRWNGNPVTPYGWKTGGQYYAPNSGPYGDDQIGDDLRDLEDLVFEDTTDYLYINGEDTGHYNQPTYLSTYLDHHFRSFVDFKNGTFIVFDKVKNNQPNLFKRFIIHLLKPYTPTISGNYIENSTAQSDVRVTAVLPAGANLSYVDEHTLHDDYVNYYRVTSTGNTAALTETFLNVIDIRDTGVAAKTVTAITASNMTGVIAGDKVIMLADNYTNADIDTAVNYNVTTIAETQHLLVNMVPTATYRVTVNNEATVNYVASNSGVLNFPVAMTGILTIAVRMDGASIPRADVDQNSTINSTDALLTLRNSLGLTMSSTNWQSSATTGDVNCDDSANSTDALLILRSSLGLDMSGTGWCVS